MSDARTSAPSWTPAETALWARIRAHPFESPDDGLDFARRLAREQGWPLTRARAAIEEYRRFCFLCCTAGAEMTPSVEVDEVWHLHLTFTRDYWQRFCPQVLGTPLHHGPTRGGRAEGLRFREQYARTLAAYERRFGPPPELFWPGARERFADPGRMRRVDLSRHLVLPRPRLPERLRLGARWRGLASLLGLLAALLPAGPSAADPLDIPLNPLDWTAGPFLTLFATLSVLAFVLAILLNNRARSGGPIRAEGLDPWELAYLAGGPERAIDAGVTELLTRDQATLDPDPPRLRLNRPVDRLPAPLRALGTAIARDGDPTALRRTAAGWIAPLRAGLISRGLAPTPRQSARARLAGAMPLLAVAGFGAAKILVGLSRDRPVGFLVVLTLVVFAIGLIVLLAAPRTTRAGERAVRDARRRHARAARAPGEMELALAVALSGAAVLAGTAYADYRGVNPASSSGGSGGESGGGDSGGGSGCGGCGGGD